MSKAEVKVDMFFKQIHPSAQLMQSFITTHQKRQAKDHCIIPFRVLFVKNNSVFLMFFTKLLFINISDVLQQYCVALCSSSILHTHKSNSLRFCKHRKDAEYVVSVIISGPF